MQKHRQAETWETGHAACFVSGTRTIEGCNPAATRTENVTNVIVGCSDYAVEGGRILTQHRRAVGVCVGIVRARAGPAATEIITGVGDEIVVGNDVHVDGQVSFINAVDAVHDQNLGRQCARYRITAHGNCVLVRCCQSQAIGPQGRAGSYAGGDDVAAEGNLDNAGSSMK